MADRQDRRASIMSFRTYQVRRMIDVQVAAMSLQSEELYPGIDKLMRSHLSTIISELGTNIVKYAGSGRILLRSLQTPRQSGIEVIAADEGPGIPDLEQALQDHYSTGKTLGLGLGAVRRLATEFDFTCPDSGGTRVRAVCWWPSQQVQTSEPTQQGSMAQRRPLEHARSQSRPETSQTPASFQYLQITSTSRNRPALGQQHSGDALLMLDHGNLSFRIVLDGAGHGPIAHQLSTKAAAVIRQYLNNATECLPLSDAGLANLDCAGIDRLMLETASVTHSQTRGSRGVAFGMAVFDLYSNRLHYLGIGNTRILKLNWKGWEGVNRDGQLGVSYRNPVVNHYPLAVDDLVIQCSDGIRSSSLRGMRAKRSDTTLDPAQVLEDLLSITTFNDDVSILLTRCHA